MSDDGVDALGVIFALILIALVSVGVLLLL